MRITLLFFAGLRERLGVSREEIDVPAEVGTLGALRSHLLRRGGAWSEALAEGKLVRMALNQDMAGSAAAIRPDDEVAFFPPVTGG